MAQLYRSQRSIAQDFDGTVGRGLFDFKSLNGQSEEIALVVDGLHFSTDGANATFGWVEAWWVHPDSSISLWLGSSKAAEMKLDSSAQYVARWCPGIVPRLPDSRLFNLAVISSGITTEYSGDATLYMRSSMDAGRIVVGGTR